MKQEKKSRYFDIADELFTQKNIEKYAEIKKTEKKNLSILETRVLTERKKAFIVRSISTGWTTKGIMPVWSGI